MTFNNEFIQYIDDITVQLQEMYEKNISPNVKIMKALKNLSDAIENLYSNYDESLFEEKSKSAINILKALSETDIESGSMVSDRPRSNNQIIKNTITSFAELVKELPEQLKYKFLDLKDIIMDKIIEVWEKWKYR